ncbi:class I SAM-dependent methyltransferase [Sphingorhabdus sp. Alg239-R122]|uniref:class I SAM-dependent methyltransferase n=1 Tax=Sphingorhabdus sp. Alg239-R122 TaxID=2305989 RepID=UPI0013D93982|nr:class I SAM-dependent methyltransferase [Sphingorhabdus sp. Alg239-R122]
MRHSIRAALAATVFTISLSACATYGDSSDIVAAPPPDFTAAVNSTGRAADDIKLDESRKPAQVLGFLGLERGDHALDILAGGGYYSEIMARAVGSEGKVTAHNVKFFTEGEKNEAKWAGVTSRNSNISVYLKPYNEFTAPAGSYDFALFHMVYHDAYWESERFKFPRMEPATLLANLYAAMKPGGIVGVVDHVADPGDTRQTVDKLHRIDPAVVKADFAAAGFVLDDESALLANADDDHAKLVFDPAVRGKTDRFIFKFRKPE